MDGKKLSGNIWIEGFDNDYQVDGKLNFLIHNPDCEEILYSGFTSEISEEFAQECVQNWRIGGLYHNYKIESQYEEYLLKTAKESIQSACSKDYCVIFRENRNEIH